MFTIDHVIFVVDDLESAGAALLERHGLASIPGGTHPGHGTGNRIVPLGDAYLELMAVVDPVEAAGSPLGRWAGSRARTEFRTAAVCLRATDLAGPAARLGEVPLRMSRITSDGSELSWELVGLDGMLEHGRPFFITWHGGVHPGTAEAPHRVEPTGIMSIRLPSDVGPLLPLVEPIPGVILGPGESMGAAVVSTTDGDLTIG